MINRKNERMIWFSVTSVLASILVVVFTSPVATAQSSLTRSIQNYIQKIETTIQVIRNNYVDPVDTDLLFNGAIEGIFNSLRDPNSRYLDEKFLTRVDDTTTGKYGGLGIHISGDYHYKRNGDDDQPPAYIRVVAPIEGTPGWRAGIQAGDLIYSINGESARGFSTEDVSERLRGQPGTSVQVTLLRDNNFTFEVNITREEIEIPTIQSAVIDSSIAYLRIREFTPFTATQVKKTLRGFQAAQLQKLIIDVRNNPGGLLSAAIGVTDMFFTDGVIVSTKFRQHQLNQVYKAKADIEVTPNTRIVVLIDKGSASASEILTGALQDRKKAVVIGENSFGKGSIQQIIPLDNAAIKITTGRYYTPNGNNIDKTGLQPDIKVELPEPTEEEAVAYATLIKENIIGKFVQQYPEPTGKQIKDFIKKQRAAGLDPGERLIRILIKQQINRKLNVPPVIDMEFDIVLQRAVEYLGNGH